MSTQKQFKALEELGRTRLSKSFFMREFLYSEISQVENIPNIPKNPDLAIAAGKQLCENVLEPIQDALGRISIRSAYRASAVNKKGNEKDYNCANNASNCARHIWDVKDTDSYLGAMACVVVTSFVPYYEKTQDWTTLAWWIHDHIKQYSEMEFFSSKYAAFNIGWRANPNAVKSILSHVKNPHTGKKGYLTKVGMDNFSGSHEQAYQEFVQQLKV